MNAGTRHGVAANGHEQQLVEPVTPVASTNLTAPQPPCLFRSREPASVHTAHTAHTASVVGAVPPAAKAAWPPPYLSLLQLLSSTLDFHGGLYLALLACLRLCVVGM